MAINQARSNKDLEQMLKPAIKLAVEYLVQKIWNENRELIRTMIYEDYLPMQYERTGEFREAWETQVHTGNHLSNTVEGRFYYSPYLMHYDSLKAQHGSPPKYYEQDVRPYLAEILYQGLAGHLFGEGRWTVSRNVWKSLEKRLGASKLKKWMKEGFAFAGLNVKSHGMAWGKTQW